VLLRVSVSPCGVSLRLEAVRLSRRPPGAWRLISAPHDDLHAQPGRRRRAGIVIVHDGQRGGPNRAQRAFGESLPRVALANDVEVDAIGPDGVGFAGAQRAERPDAAIEGRVDLPERV